MIPSSLLQATRLWRTLVGQDLVARYRGTLLGRAWPVLMPLVMLAVYGFVFGAVFRARWPGLADDDHLGFTLNLFAGLLLHGMMGESVGQSPDLLLRNSNFVRKVVFPLPVLVAVPLGSAVVHGLVGLALLVLVNGLFGTGFHASVLALPLVLLPYVAMLYGLSLGLAGLGVYVRDLGQVTGVLVMLALFTAAVFFPREMVPPALAGVVDYNPLTWPVSAVRDATLLGQWPVPGEFLRYGLAAVVVLGAGWLVFAKLRRGFADVL